MGTANKNSCSPKGIAVWTITPGGVRLGLRVCEAIDGTSLYLPEAERHLSGAKTQALLYSSLSQEIQKRFREYRCHIFIFATGIAVRVIAPLLASKLEDPAVVVMDEKGLFAISLVSGHIGGANALARKISETMGAVPVITTATDINHLPSIDLIADDQDLVIETPGNIKHVNMKFLRGEPISIFDPMGVILPQLPESLIKSDDPTLHSDITCTHETGEVSRETLILRPRNLSLGIGCNRGTSRGEILDLIKTVFEKEHLSLLSIRSLASSEIKKDEAGLVEAARELELPVIFYSNDELNGVETIENPSKMAEKHIGVKSVCEAAAILGAGLGSLMVPKRKTRNVTLAVAVIK